MNAYDFDGTVYRGDSSRDFLLFCLRRHPLSLRRLPQAFLSLAMYALGKRSRDAAKEQCFSVLKDVDDVPNEVSEFWTVHASRIEGWYRQIARVDDLWISASPGFLLRPIAKRLGIHTVIATEVDIDNGKLLTPNCRGTEKVRRLLAEFPSIEIDHFYSDSLSDEPMAHIANDAHLVNCGKVDQWPTRVGQ